MKKLALAAIVLPLAGCISFSPKPPASLLTLTPASAIAVGQPQRAPGNPTISIAVPSVPQEVATLRVPVRATPTTIAYVKDARWVEPVNRQFARLLADTVTTRAGRVVVSDRQAGVEIGASLGGELRSFGVDAASGQVVVTYDAVLIRAAGTPLEKRRFEARVPATAIEAVAVGAALNQAANQVAVEVADWVGR
jgi:cholesterol transport system auxiliary component